MEPNQDGQNQPKQDAPNPPAAEPAAQNASQQANQQPQPQANPPKKDGGLPDLPEDGALAQGDVQAAPAPKDNKNNEEKTDSDQQEEIQFDTEGMQYDKGSRVIYVWLGIVVVAVLALLGFLFLTDAGKSLIGLGTPASNTNTTTNTTTQDTQQETNTDEVDYSDAEAEAVVDDVVEELESVEKLEPEEDFDDVDEELEFGL